MGVGASASISIVKDGVLWGLIACHHRTPIAMPLDVRLAGVALAGGLARQIRTLEDEEIEAVKIESRKTLELVQFVDADEIEPLWYEKPYYVVPADDLAEEAYVVLREALRGARKVALGQLSVRGREHLVSLKPCGRGIVLEVLRYADEVHKARGFFAEIPDEAPSEDLLDLATTLIDKKTAPFRPEEFHDRYVDALHRLVEKKVKARGKKILEDVSEPGARGGNVIDLMAALKKSLGSSTGAKEDDERAAKEAPKKRAPARRKKA